MAGIVVSAMLAGSPAAEAWTGEGHSLATGLAVSWVHSAVPQFLSQGAGTICHCSIDPDLFKSQADCNALYAAEYPDHFFDLEYFTDRTLPRDRAAFTSWCLNHHQWPFKVGTVPYAVTEWTYRLAAALAEHRLRPQDPAIQAKCLVYAGLLSHYAQDMAMPLHATADYDGRAAANGDSPHTGIHTKADALLAKVTLSTAARNDPGSLAPFEDVLGACLAQLRESHSQVDRLYAMEGALPDVNSPMAQGGSVETFARERLRVSAQFTARLLATAWDKSRSVEIPAWYARDRGPEAGQEKRRMGATASRRPWRLRRPPSDSRTVRRSDLRASTPIPTPTPDSCLLCSAFCGLSPCFSLNSVVSITGWSDD
jgi:hypothetical protein